MFYVLITACFMWTLLVMHGVPALDFSRGCSCYSFLGTSRSWSYGRKQCRSKGGDLVSMETVEEWEFIKTEIQSKTTVDGINEWWIGLEKRDRKWKWLSNHTLTYDKWQRDEPSNHSDETNALIAKNYPPHTYGLLSDAPYLLPRGCICEYKEPKVCNTNQRIRWCSNQTTTTSTTIPTEATVITTRYRTTIANRKPTVNTLADTDTTSGLPISTPNNKQKEKTNTNYQPRTIVLQKQKKTSTTISVPTDTGSRTQTKHLVYDCLPYPLFVIAIFVSVVGGLTVLSVAVLFLVGFILRKKRLRSESD